MAELEAEGRGKGLEDLCRRVENWECIGGHRRGFERHEGPGSYDIQDVVRRAENPLGAQGSAAASSSGVAPPASTQVAAGLSGGVASGSAYPTAPAVSAAAAPQSQFAWLSPRPAENAQAQCGGIAATRSGTRSARPPRKQMTAPVPQDKVRVMPPDSPKDLGPLRAGAMDQSRLLGGAVWA